MDQKTLKALQEIINKALINVATKDDLKNFATKDDLKNFATKDDLKSTKIELMKEIRDVELTLTANADKNKEELMDEIKEVEISVTLSADTNKAEKSTVDELDRRVTRLERKASSH